MSVGETKAKHRANKAIKKAEDPITPLGNRWLHEALTDIEILNIKHIFFQEETKELNAKQLRKALLDCGHITFEDAQFEITFRRINIKRDDLVTWDEFISHLILGFKIQEVPTETKQLDNPISKMPRLVKSNHRHPINQIKFNFQVKPDRSYSFADGSYITSSKDGFINYWSLDLQIERTVQAKRTDLKITDTYVLCFACLPDVSVICTGSTERDLRFYDTSAKKFELRVQFIYLEYAVCSMCYVFSKDISEESKLIIGDMGGNVRVIMFSPINRGPFRSRLGIPLLRIRYAELLKINDYGFHVIEFKGIHGDDWVRQVEYYHTLNFIVSCSTSSKALVMRDINENRGVYNFNQPKGAWCFALADGFPMIATGGPDCLVRVWNPYVTKRPIVTFHGHHTGVVGMVLQDKGELLCSLSEDKCIRIWDVPAQECIQTYLSLGSEMGEYTELTIFYNPESRQVLIGSMVIAILSLRPLQNAEHTDGNSHSAGISVLLYNPLFKIILTCGLDSLIIVWDPWSGKRISVVRNAHTRMLHGEVIPVDITAGTFDPGHQLLLTGAHDGSLKTWNFNTGTCLRNMRIEKNCEVTGVCWIKGRILAIGWNKHVTEFADSGAPAGPGVAFTKSWSTRHTSDVLCAASRIPQSLATSTYNGELVLWRLETGQPYKQYSVAYPTRRIKISYDFERHSRASFQASQFRSRLKKKEVKVPLPEPPKKEPEKEVQKSVLYKSAQPEIQNVLKFTKRFRPLVLPTSICPTRGMAARCMLFLSSRPMEPKIGTLLVALENGDIQIWSHHVSGGYLSAFQCVHTIGDYAISMASDEQNEYLFVGSTEGYIKTFLMKGYYSGADEHICMPAYRLKFPFLWKTFFEGRAQKALRDQEKPILLNSYKAHRTIVSCLTYIDESHILVSASTDFSARLWTLAGRYLGTLGTFKKWNPLNDSEPTARNFPHTVPPDIKRVMSSTTLRVLMGYDFPNKLTKKQAMAQAEKEMCYKEGLKTIYGKKLEDPVLGHYISMPEKTTQKHEITLDTTFPYIPVYQHLIRPGPGDLQALVQTKAMSKAPTETNLPKRDKSYY